VNKKTLKFMGSAVMLAAIVSSTGCKSSSKEKEGKGAAQYTESSSGVTETTTRKTKATVTAVDPASRQVTLATPDGASRTYTLGPEVRNFDQIHVGDHVKAAVSEEVTLFLSKNGQPASGAEGTAVMRAPAGAKPGMAIANTSSVTGRIVAIEGRDVTLQFPDGTPRKIKVGKEADLSNLRPGDPIAGQITQSVAITVEKPGS